MIIDWKYRRENDALIRMTEAMQEVTKVYGCYFVPLIFWELFRKTVAVHSLGDCWAAESPDKGLVSPRGDMFGYPGCYVAIGFHLVMTISAMEEYIAEGAAQSLKTRR